MKPLSLITLVAMLVVPLHAHAQIEGGFGLKLGDVFDVDSNEVEAIEKFDNTVYRVKPPKPLTGFDDYMVYITPLTHKIYQIKAFHHFKLADAAKAEYGVLRKVLETKYKNYADNRVVKGRPAGSSITLKHRDSSVNIKYYDSRNIAQVDRILERYIYPRVVITYRSKDYELRDEEFRLMYQNRQELEEANGNTLAEEAESIL